MEYQIYSFGNGEILKGVFNAIAMCLNSHSGSLFVPLIRIGLLIGAVFAIVYAIYGNYMRAFVGWIIPISAIMQVLFVPQATVWIIDPVSRYHEKVDHVPYGLAMVSSYISRFGYVITEQIEKIFVLPDDLKYQKTGTLFGSYLIQQAKTFHITNEDLAENMRQFVGQCVVYDALLGKKYTIDDLRNSPNIWELVTNNASPARSFLWREPHLEGRQQNRPEIVTCRKGVELFNRQWGGELNRCGTIFGQKIFGIIIDARKELLKYLPIAYGHLGDMGQSAAEILKQNLMIYAVVDGIEQKSVAVGNAPNFAVRRAYLQQRSTYETIGAMAAEMLPTMKSTFEAIAYAMFLFIIPLSLLPMGWRFLTSWMQILLWLQMWPPLYAVLNYIMTMAARSKSIAALSISNKAGVTIASSVGLANINADIAAMAGYLAMSIPFLCMALVRGVGSFAHLASNLSQVSQSAGSQAANDAVTGNYSFGNIQEGNRQISNVSMLNHSYAASYRAGSFHQSDGRSDILTTADGQQILNVSSSNIPVSINAAETKTAQLSHMASNHYQKAIANSEASSKSLASSYRELVDLSQQLSKGEHLSDSVSSGKSIDQTNSIQKASQMIESFGKENGLNKQQTADLMAEVGAGLNLGYYKASGSARLSGTAYDQELYRKAEQLSKSEDFQHAIREAMQASQTLSHSETNETTRRLSESVAGSYDKSDHFREEAMKSFRASEDYQRQASHTQAFASTINANYTQEFTDWLANQPADNTGGTIGKHGAGHIVANEPNLRIRYAEQFLNEKGLSPRAPTEVVKHGSSGHHLRESYEHDNAGKTYPVSENTLNQVREEGHRDNINWDEHRAQTLRQEVSNSQMKMTDQIKDKEFENRSRYQQSAKEFSNRKDKMVAGQAIAAEAQHVTQPIDSISSYFISKPKEDIKGESQTKE